MKRLLVTIKTGVLLAVVSCCVSCMNGGDSPWVGRWQLREYQYPDGTVQKVDSVFYGFQKGSFIAVYMGTANVNDTTYKKWFGWEDERRSFRVVSLTSKRMKLDYKDTVYVFRLY